MKNGFYILIVLFISISCESKVRYDKEMLSYFDDHIIDHFPSNVPSFSYSIRISQNIKNHHPYVHLKFKSSKSKFTEIKKLAGDKAIARYNSDDSCLLVIDKHVDKNDIYKIDKTLRIPVQIIYEIKECFDGKLAVPKFFNPKYGGGNSVTNLDGYELYVIDSKPGIFMDSTKLPNGLYTPFGWEHGISKGIAIRESDRSIIYWSDIW